MRVFALLALAGCGASPPPGVARVSFSVPAAAAAYAGRAVLPFRVDYAGPRRVVQVREDVWIGGELQSPSRMSREVWHGPRAEVTFILEDAKPAKEKGFAIESEFEFPSGWGGSTTVGSRGVLAHPGAKHWITLTRAAGTVDIPDGGELAFWAILGDDEPIQPAEGTLDEAAQRVDWALVLRLRLAP